MDPLFEVHKLNAEGLTKAKFIAESFDSLLTDLREVCNNDNREFSLCKTHLEQACLYAKKSMAMQSGNQEK